MTGKFWKKHEKIKEIGNNNSIIKSYIARMEPIVKEIRPKDEEEYELIILRLEEIKKEIKIYDIVKEDEVIYIIIENDVNINAKVEKLLSEELDFQMEGIVEGYGTPIKKKEIENLLKMEKSMCKIESETKDNKKIRGTGFFCELIDCPIKYALFTNNHILDETNIEIGNTIKFEFLEYKSSFFYYSSYNPIKKEIKITDKRRVFTNKTLDYTCIELFKSDGIIDYFKIDPKLFKHNYEIFKNNDIFILQFPQDNDISFSYGKILSCADHLILHNASTEVGSSGSPIIKRSDDNYVIGLHRGGIKKNKKCEYNLASNFISIIDDIKGQIKGNEINCVYIRDEEKNVISLLHDYNDDMSELDENCKEIYLEAGKLNRSIFEDNMELYINGKKTKFEYKYRMKDLKEINVKFKFKKKIKYASYMFNYCKNLRSIDLSSFNTYLIKDTRCMFNYCESLISIDLNSFDTSNVTNMRSMFQYCSSLTSLDLSSFNTCNVIGMEYMFNNCSSLESIDLSSFDTSKVNNMEYMFNNCSSLKSINLLSFNTTNVKNMGYMFNYCQLLTSIDLSSFDTSNVFNMECMFNNCSSLETIDLSSFNINNVENTKYMFENCSCLKNIL